MEKNKLKNRFSKAIFSLFFAFLGVFSSFSGLILTSESVYADPVDENIQTVNDEESDVTIEYVEDTEEEADVVEEEVVEENVETENTTTKTSVVSGLSSGDGCKKSLGEIGWWVCPNTGKIAEAVDWLYDKIENILVIEPISVKDGTPIYEIWKYCRGLTNIAFIILLLVVIFSQVTGIGISNYGIKKILPRLIIVAVLINLSFLICTLAVDISNILGNGLRGIFSTIAESAVAGNAGTDLPIETKLSYARMYSSLASAAPLAVAGIGLYLMFEPGAIWMLIPVVLGAIVAVASGLITIALRQAVVALLIMISPFAMVAYMLPNTDKWFVKWKDLLTKMLVFYPMFSLLFGASNLAGFAIIASAKDGFGVLLGAAVQIFPLFFSWNLMKMSGTFLGSVNNGIRSLAARPLAANSAWADSHRKLTQAKFLEKNRLPSARLMNFLAYRQTKREAEIDEMNKHRQTKFMARRALSKYDKDGNPSKQGKEEYDRQHLSMRYMQIVEMHKTNMNEGFGAHSAGYKNTIAGMKKDFNGSRGVYASALGGGTQEEQIHRLDMANMNAADDLKAEIARGAEVEYGNAKGFFERALNAKFAEDDRRALLAGDNKHQMHPGVLNNPENLARYERWKSIMEGKDDGVQTVLADAASSIRAQAQIRRDKFQAKADLTPATQDVANHISDLVNSGDVVENIDAIIGGLRILNMRGDTDMVAKELEHNIMGILNKPGTIELGTYASQAIANYTMFDVKDNDPVLRRFGKYINMQTAALYNESDPNKRRHRRDVSWWEYINSEYVEYDDDGNVAHDENGKVITKKTRGMRELMPGTSYGRVERTAYKSQREGVRAASYDLESDGSLSSEFSVKRYLDNMDSLYDSTLANIISDQFSYLSGGEQIMALAKDLTGVGKDGKFDWKYIFGDEINPTLEQKAEAIIRGRDVVKKFLGGHVTNQIARSKTDMLQAIRSQYALLDEVMYENEEGKEVVDLERLRELEERGFVDGDENTPGSYKHFLQEKQAAIKERFRKSFKENALKTLAKQIKRGYQGDSKELLSQMLDLEELYDYYYPNDKNGQTKRRAKSEDEEDEDGKTVDESDGELGGGSGLFNGARVEVESLLKEYRGSKRMEVGDFWEEVKDILASVPEMGDFSAEISYIDESLSQYTDVSQLYDYIMRAFFGSD